MDILELQEELTRLKSIELDLAKKFVLAFVKGDSFKENKESNAIIDELNTVHNQILDCNARLNADMREGLYEWLSKKSG